MIYGREHLTPWDMADEDHEPAAPMCLGPGHTIVIADDRETRIADCPDCIGRIRNHLRCQEVTR